MSDRDYYHIDVPSSKAPEDYEWWERRAEILDLILRRGTPHGVKQARLAERYDVSPSQISQDMDRLRQHVDNHLGRSAKMTTRATYQKAIEQAQEQGEWRDAFEIAMEWNRWLQDIGEQETEPDKHEISGELSTEHTEKKMMVGLDLQAFPDVDTSRMVGVDLRESEGDAPEAEAAENGDSVPIDVENTQSGDADPGGNADTNGSGGGDS